MYSEQPSVRIRVPTLFFSGGISRKVSISATSPSCLHVYHSPFLSIAIKLKNLHSLLITTLCLAESVTLTKSHHGFVRVFVTRGSENSKDAWWVVDWNRRFGVPQTCSGSTMCQTDSFNTWSVPVAIHIIFLRHHSSALLPQHPDTSLQSSLGANQPTAQMELNDNMGLHQTIVERE